MFPPGGVCALFKMIFFHSVSFILYFFLHPWYGGVLPKLDVKMPRKGEALLDPFWVNRSQEAGEATGTSVQAQVPDLYCRLQKLDFSWSSELTPNDLLWLAGRCIFLRILIALEKTQRAPQPRIPRKPESWCEALALSINSAQKTFFCLVLTWIPSLASYKTYYIPVGIKGGLLELWLVSCQAHKIQFTLVFLLVPLWLDIHTPTITLLL